MSQCNMLRLFSILVVASVLLAGCTTEAIEKPPLNVSRLNMAFEYQIALEKAITVYQQAIADGVDLTTGPCLSNELHGNPAYPETMWVLDIAHYPREAADDLPANQCVAYREGKAKNFIEFDEQGKLIKFYSPLMKD